MRKSGPKKERQKGQKELPNVEPLVRSETLIAVSVQFWYWPFKALRSHTRNHVGGHP